MGQWLRRRWWRRRRWRRWALLGRLAPHLGFEVACCGAFAPCTRLVRRRDGSRRRRSGNCGPSRRRRRGVSAHSSPRVTGTCDLSIPERTKEGPRLGHRSTPVQLPRVSAVAASPRTFLTGSRGGRGGGGGGAGGLTSHLGDPVTCGRFPPHAGLRWRVRLRLRASRRRGTGLGVVGDSARTNVPELPAPAAWRSQRAPSRDWRSFIWAQVTML
jgi:hypothetical protein